MSLQLKPYRWNWATIATGNTYPASQIVESNSDYDGALERVLVTIKDSDGNIFTQLDSETGGVVINDDTASQWDFTIGAIAAPLIAGIYTVETDCFDSNSVEATLTRGNWEII